MKSVIITFLIFAILFGLLKLNIMVIFDGFWFPMISLIVLLIVFAIAVAMFGLPTSDDFKKALNFKKKEVNDEKDK